MTSDFFALALTEARKAAALGEVPVGVVIVRGGKVIATTSNLVETHKDPTSHAEMLAIRAACKAVGNERLEDCDIYVTLEPCAMCAQALAHARIRRVYFGAYDEKSGGVENGARVFNHSHHKPEIYGGIQESECSSLLKDFFRQLR